MKYFILILILLLLNSSSVNAKLNEEQLEYAIKRFQEKMPNCPVEEIRNFILKVDCDPIDIDTGIPIKCGDDQQHFYVCKMGIHYLDNEIISILSSNTEYNYAQTLGDNSPAVIGDNNEIIQDNDSLFINLFWSKGTIGGIILSALIWILRNILYDKWKERKIIKIEANLGFNGYEDGGTSDTLLYLTAINNGKSSIHLSSVGLKAKDNNILKIKNSGLPVELKVGKSHIESFKLDQLKDKTINFGWYMDETGRVYKSKSIKNKINNYFKSLEDKQTKSDSK